MQARLVLAAVILGTALTGCTGAITTAAPSDPASEFSQPSADSTATGGDGLPSSSGDPAASVKSYGVSSAECTAASDVLQAATKFGITASTGTATEAGFTEAYTGNSANTLPVDALATFADLKTVSLTVVGLDQQQASKHLPEFSLALSNFARVTQKICS